jgi:hypothetical protein
VREETPTVLVPLEIESLGLALSKGPTQYVSLTSPEDGNIFGFRNDELVDLEYWTMDRVQKPGDS